jgi:hypothetical protein
MRVYRNLMNLLESRVAAAFRGSRAFKWALWIIDLLFGLLGVFLPFPWWVSLPCWVVVVIANHIITPKVFERIFMADLSFHGELLPRHFSPLPLDEEVLDKHRQLDSRLGVLCIPMIVEFGLKLEGRIPPEDFRLQRGWVERQSANFSDFDGQTIEGLKFRRQFSNDRGDKFPLDRLFATIEHELAARRYVMISLAVDGGNWHNYLIYNRLPNGEFEAVTKGRTPETINNVVEQVRKMQGTDILTYEHT